MTVKDVWYRQLEDDSTPYGGISYDGETVCNFATDMGICSSQPIEELNKVLKECGIKTIE